MELPTSHGHTQRYITRTRGYHKRRSVKGAVQLISEAFGVIGYILCSQRMVYGEVLYINTKVT